MAQGIILAGGYSSRIEQNKMCLLYLNKPLICHTIESMMESVTKIIVVSGFYHEEIVEAVKKYTIVKVVRNLQYDRGMFSSVLHGVAEIDDDFFLIPGDYPNIRKSTYATILKSTGDFIVPTIGKRKGHPVFIKKELIPDLQKEALHSNLKEFRDKHQVTYIEVLDEGILEDIDTLQDYEKLVRSGKE